MSYDPKWIRDDAVVKRDGTNDLTGDWDIGNQRKIILEELQMRDASGLTIADTTSNILVSVDNQTGLFSLQIGTGINEFSTDGALTGNSDAAVPTEKAVKTYIDNHTGGTTTSYLHTQSFDSTSWIVVHNLGHKYANVEVIDSSDLSMIPDEISFDNTSQLTITFIEAESGHAVIISAGS